MCAFASLGAIAAAGSRCCVRLGAFAQGAAAAVRSPLAPLLLVLPERSFCSLGSMLAYMSYNVFVWGYNEIGPTPPNTLALKPRGWGGPQ